MEEYLVHSLILDGIALVRQWLRILILNRPGVAGAVLQTPLKSIQRLTNPSLQYQTERARDLKFWDTVNHPLCVTCHMSGVWYHVSCIN